MWFASELERRQLFGHRGILQGDIFRHPLLVGRIIFSLDQRIQVLAALVGNAVAVLGDEILGHELLHVGHLRQGRLADLPDIGLRRLAHHRGHDGFFALKGKLHARLTQGIGLLHIGFGGQVACRPLQVIGHRPVELVARGILDHVGDHRRRPTELGVAEGVPGPLLGQEFSIRPVATLGHADGAVAELLDLGLDRRQELLLIELHLREQRQDRNALIRDQGAGGGDPAGVTAHDLDDEDLGGRGAHGAHIEGGLQGGGGDVLGDGAETRTVVRDGQVIVHRLGHMDRLHRIAHGVGELGDLIAGIRGVAAAVVEEIADVVGLEDLDQALVLTLVGLQALELIAAGTQAAGGRVAEGRDIGGGLFVGVDQVFGEGADDAVASGIDVGDLVRILAGGFDHPAGGGVDHGGDSAGLSVKGVFRGHGSPLIGLKYGLFSITALLAGIESTGFDQAF